MFDYIDSVEKLTDLLDRLQNVEWVTLDTEFIREKTYYPRLCLIQLASADILACIDPLQVTDLKPFMDWLYTSPCVKVLHAAWQDLEIFHHLGGGKVPAPVFDSQIAAAVLGMGDQLGYARLVEMELGIALDKSQSRTDWSRRPLTPAQLAYAVDDVRYLRDIYQQLHKRLLKLGRLGWLEKPLQKLADPQTYDVDPQRSWERIRGVQILKPHQLPVLRELAAWRECRALQRDIPRRWILSDEILLDMARMLPGDAEAFHQIRGLSGEQISRHAPEWLELITKGKNLPRTEWPQLPRRHKLNAEMAVTADLLTALVNQLANRHGISASLIASRQQLEKMLEEGRMILADDWRGTLVNGLFEQVLSGQAVIRVRDQQLCVEPCA